jgi:spoIIIJ-associated protein
MSDLDKYLENIGISTSEEETRSRPQAEGAESSGAGSSGAGSLNAGSSDADVSERISPTSTSVRVEGTPRERAESFLVNLLVNFDPAYAVEIARADESEILVDVYGGDPGKIIGRDGRTLQALEYLTNTVLNRGEGGNVRVTIDVGGYKRRRDDRLRDVAEKVALRVRETGEPFVFKPMSSAERRVIHMQFADDPSLMSESEGEGRERRVVVKLRT